MVLPHSRCLGSDLLPGRGEQGSPFHLGLEGRQGEGGLEGGSGVATQGGHLPSVPPLHAPLHPLSASGCIALATPGNWKLIFHNH